MAAPAAPKIYHITHWENLPGIIDAGVIWSDAKRIELNLTSSIVGLSTIKQRRLEELVVKCHPPTKVGEYVPFYFCPRSIMLYILHMDNNPELTYHGGQAPIVHLVADLKKTVAWAQVHERHWAFTDGNAGTRYANFFARLRDLDEIDWPAVDATDFRDSSVKEGKQAEFLLYESFPWELVEAIGVFNRRRATQVNDVLAQAQHKPTVSVQHSWYYEEG